MGQKLAVKLVRSTKKQSDAVTGRGVQAHIWQVHFSEKPKATTYCDHLFK